MARFENGHPRLPGSGRQKGQPNKATRNAREAIALLIERNIGRLQDWLDEIAEKQGAHAAMRCFVDLLEYNVPKLTRAELTVQESDDDPEHVFDASKLSWDDRQALKTALEVHVEIMDRYKANRRRDAASNPAPDDPIGKSSRIDAEEEGQR